MTKQIRLNKYMASAGVASRRQIDQYISNGEVYVNGKPAMLGQLIDPDTDTVTLHSRSIGSPHQPVYYALYKPVGVISTAKDECNRKTVIDLVPREPRVYPVGRLDTDSEGLIILTNDGDLTYQLTHPSQSHEKEYRVTVAYSKDAPTEGDISVAFSQGILINDHLMKADRVYGFTKHRKDNKELLSFSIVLYTGLNRQIRRMCAKLGLEVVVLKRIRIANLHLNSLNIKPGEYIKINKTNII
ncbi:MAG: Ribosomal large subunit pseudouridine synthase F [bacterium ADurb.Bin400]|nr:MAG: Ribosomal large subunit pseudouridine synthase F [bacterium ADurb.Bin400]